VYADEKLTVFVELESAIAWAITVMQIKLSLQKNAGSEKNTFAAVSGLGG
jgi:hypothetical protein